MSIVLVQGDYSVCRKNGKSFRMIQNRYVLGDMLGRPGGFGSVYKVFDNVEKVFKAIKFLHKPRTAERQVVETLIEQNVQGIKRIQQQNNGTFYGNDSIVRVYEVFRLPVSNQLAYVMEYVDCTKLFTMKDVLNNHAVLDAEQKCEIAISLAEVFGVIHTRGFAYKDINEGNIFLGKDGKIKIIDVDNIAPMNCRTVGGTDGYMAPEIYAGALPNTYTDHMSLAIFYYRLMLGKNHFPFDGKWREKFFMDNNDSYTSNEMDLKMNGRKAVFVFDPFDDSNTIRGVNNIDNQGKLQTWRQCVAAWDYLPKVIRDSFIKTFSDGRNPENVARRMTDSGWNDVFHYVKTDAIIQCPNCRKKLFNSGSATIPCTCGNQINNGIVPDKELSDIVLAAVPYTRFHNGIIITATSRINGHSVTLDNIQLRYLQNLKIYGDEIFMSFGHSPLFQLKYSAERNAYAIKNLTANTWTCSLAGNQTGTPVSVEPNYQCVLKEGLQINVEDQKYTILINGIV